jgi:hypothetical protein
MRGNALYAYDLTAEGDTLKGRTVGKLIEGAESVDCRALCVGPGGKVWCAITEHNPNLRGVSLLHYVSYTPGEKAPLDHGPVAIANPDYTKFTDESGKQLPYHHGMHTMPDGTATSKYSILGVCEGKDGNVYALMLAPFTLLQVSPDQLKR